MTILKFLENTYLFQFESKIQAVQTVDTQNAIILEATIFYPQGGGQPSDTGKIFSSKGCFQVENVRLDEAGVVWHFGFFESGALNAGDSVSLELNEARRILNAKNHSAGHLIDCAVAKERMDMLKPIKGYHFPEGPYVEYEGKLDNPENYILALQKRVDDLIAQNLRLEKKEYSPKEAKEKGIWAPAGKSARVVNFQGFEGCGCGGTHVNTSSEIGKITLRKIKSKKDKTKIHYTLN